MSCDGTGSFAETRVYGFDLVEAHTGTPALTLVACKAAQPDPDLFVNCWRTLVLCPSGDAQFMETDVVEPARYVVDGRALDVALGPNGRGVRFQLSADGEAAERVGTGERWIRWRADDERADALFDACRP